MLAENRPSSDSDKANSIVPQQTKRELVEKQIHREQQFQATPYWAEPLPLPPEVDFVGEAQEDLKTLALLAAVRQIADQNGNSVAAQLDNWNYGRG